MSTPLTRILGSWDALWRFPRLLTLVRRSVEPDEVAMLRGLLEGLAESAVPETAFRKLVEAQDLDEAREVLETRAFTRLFSKEELARLREDLERAEVQARADLSARAIHVATRARIAGIGVDPRIHAAALRDDLRSASALIDDQDSIVGFAEEEARAEILAQVASVPSPGGEADARWRDAVRRCIDERRLDWSREVLAGGPSGALPDYPFLIPRPRAWPWNVRPRDVVAWIRGEKPSPSDFRASWAPAAGDLRTLRLVDAIDGVFAAQSPDSVAELVIALDEFLGAAPPGIPVVPGRGGFWAHLAAAVDPRLPCLYTANRCVPIWVSEKKEPPSDEHRASVLWFTPSEGAPRRGVIQIDPTLLFRLMADECGRRVNFLRALGAQVDLTEAMGTGGADLEMAVMERWDTDLYARWILDVHSLPTAPQVVASITSCCAGRLDLLLRFLSHAFATTARVRGGFDAQSLERASGSKEWSQRVRTALVPQDADARAVLRTATEYRDALTAADLALLLSDGARTWDDDSVTRALHPLTVAGLLRDAGDGKVQITTPELAALIQGVWQEPSPKDQ